MWRELTLGLGLFALYAVVDLLHSPAREAAAHQRGRDLLAAERAIGLPVEEWLNEWLVPHETLRIVANYEYAVTYVVSALALLVWLYLRRPAVYSWARSTFVLLNLIAVGCFALWPVAPPRLLDNGVFVDTVRADGTIFSWGSPLVSQANQMAAMPSLHIAWAVWVSVVLALLSSRWWVQGLSAVHVTVTLWVILATANHYWLDAVGGVLLVAVSMGLMALVRDRPGHDAGPRVASADAFFLYVESPAAPQHVGGLVVMDSGVEPSAYRDRLAAALRERLADMPRFRQRLSAPSRWRYPRWVPAGDLDWDWHVPLVEAASLDALMAGIQAAPLPRDRPLWRAVVVTGFAPGRIAVLLQVHHVVADGLGTIAHAAFVLEPELTLPALPAPPPLKRAIGAVVGIAQLATDGPNRYRLPGRGFDGQRRFATTGVPLARLKAAARAHGVRVSDVLLSVTAGALRRARTGVDDLPPVLRTSVPLMMRGTGSAAEGNVTAAVMIDLPLGPMPETERLAATARRTGRLRSPTRALGGRFVMAGLTAVLPPPLQAWFARTVYGERFFQAIVSNMPGPTGTYRMAGEPMREVYPVLPLAPRAPLAVGALSWDGTLFIGVSAAPGLLADADRFAAGLRATLDELSPPSVDGWLQANASTSRARLSGVSKVDPNSA